MKQKLVTSIGLFLLFTSVYFFSNPAHAEIYQLETDEKIFDIEYSLNGDIIAMATDKETISLLIATENVEDSEFTIKLPNDLIRAENNEFAVLVNGFEVDYEIISTDNVHLSFFIPTFTEEIEIIGTYVIPEFPLGILMMFGTVSALILLLQRTKKSLFR